MTDDIQIGMDNSGAIRGLQQIRQASEDVAKALGLTDAQGKKLSNTLERGMASAIAMSLKNQAAQTAAANATKKNTQAIDEQAAAARRLAEQEKKVFAAMGLARNSSGNVINSDTGRFANKEQIAAAKSLMAVLQQSSATDAQLQRQRDINAQNAYNRTKAQTQAVREESEAYKQRQAILERAFSSKVVGLAAPDAGPWQRFYNVLNQIPPLTWTQRLGSATSALMHMDNSARYALYSVAGGAAIAGAAITGFGVAAVKAAIDHERAFANVARTTQATAQGYEFLQRQLELMAMEIPISFEELTKIATAAGQLGIQATGIANFTRTVAMLTATTNLTSEAAGNALARFKAFFAVAKDPSLAVTESTFSNLASSILKVGVNSIATESGIVNVSTQISSMGKLAGLTANQVIGFAGALSSIGVAPELARGITTRLFTIIGDAVSQGGVQLEKFAAISGLTATQFADAWGTERFAPVFTSFIHGLHSISEDGGDANAALRDLGITAVRDRPVWLRLADAAGETGEAGSLLAQTLRDAESGWRGNTELALQYTKISQTAAARIQVMTQAFEQLFASMGQETGNFVGELALGITGLVRSFDEFAQSDIGKVLGTAVTQGALLLGAVTLLIGVLAGLAATIQGVGSAFVAMQAAGVTASTRLTAAFRIASLSLGALGLLGTLAAIVGMFIAMADSSQRAASPVSDLNGLVAAMKSDADAGAEGLKFYSNTTAEAAAESKNSAEQAGAMTEALHGVTAGAQVTSGAMDSMGNTVKRVAGVFGPAAREFFKAQLAMDEGWQNLWDSARDRDLNEAFDFDWDKIIDVSVDPNGDVEAEVEAQLLQAFRNAGVRINSVSDATGIDWQKLTGADNAFGAAIEGLGHYNEIVKQLGGTGSSIQGMIDGQSALAATSSATVNQMVDDYELLDDVTKKTVDNMTAGFQRFADTGNLIKLTQESISTEDDAAEKFRQSWEDAYGGASFSIESYMAVFRTAAQEQRAFIDNLSELSARGLSSDIIQELAAMGPEANRLVQALVVGTDAQLQEFEALWGQTGYDSMVQFATQAAIGQAIIKNVMAAGGLDALRAFNDQLASGAGVDEALASLQLDLNGNPMKVEVRPKLTAAQLQAAATAAADSGIRVPIIPYLTKTTVYVGPITPKSTGGSYTPVQLFDQGGYTGYGGKYDPAGVVHKDEFVFDRESTRAIGVANLYAMMNAARGGRSAPRGRGYADGGMVTGRTDTMVVELSAYDRKLLQERDVTLMIDGKVIANATNSANFVSSQRGVS